MLLPSATRIRRLAVVDSVAGSQTNQAPSVASIVAALAAKADASHSHIIGNVTGLQTALDGKASASHTHAISDVTSLQTALDGKQSLDATLTALAGWAYSSGVELPTFTAADTLAILRVGTAANNLVQMTGATKLPDVDGSLLTALNADQITSGTLALARLLSGSDANPLCAVLANDLSYSGTSSQATLQLTIPSTGRWFLFEQLSFSAGISQTFTSQLSMGTAEIAGTTNDSVGIGIAGTAVASCAITTGSPTVVSGRASSGLNTSQFVVWVLDVTTAGTIDLKVAPNNGSGSPYCRKGGFFKAIKLG